MHACTSRMSPQSVLQPAAPRATFHTAAASCKHAQVACGVAGVEWWRGGEWRWKGRCKGGGKVASGVPLVAPIAVASVVAPVGVAGLGGGPRWP